MNIDYYVLNGVYRFTIILSKVEMCVQAPRTISPVKRVIPDHIHSRLNKWKPRLTGAVCGLFFSFHSQLKPNSSFEYSSRFSKINSLLFLVGC